MITLKNKYLSVNINPMGAEVVKIIKMFVKMLGKLY